MNSNVCVSSVQSVECRVHVLIQCNFGSLLSQNGLWFLTNNNGKTKEEKEMDEF